MKNFLIYFGITLTVLASTAFAGPNASGGTAETSFQHDRSAMSTILQNPEVLRLLVYKGSIEGFYPVKGENDVFVIMTEKCQLQVKFVRTCTFDTGLPNCEYNSEVLHERSVGDCAN